MSATTVVLKNDKCAEGRREHTSSDNIDATQNKETVEVKEGDESSGDINVAQDREIEDVQKHHSSSDDIDVGQDTATESGYKVPLTCDTDFDSLSKHQGSHRNGKLFTCEHCGTSFKSLSNISAHRRVFAERLYHCKKCGEECSTACDAMSHRRIHIAKKPEPVSFNEGTDKFERLCKCLICGKSFRNKDFLERHERTHTEESHEEYGISFSYSKSQTDGKRYKYSETIVSSLSGKKPFACSVCGEKFGKANSVLRHRRTYHNKEKPYQCFKCGEAFACLTDILIHRRTHANLTCQICSRVFQSNSDLIRHHWSHSRPYQCLQCSKRFLFMSALYVHERNHFERRRYKGKRVGKWSSQASSFTRYQRPLTGKEVYKCLECSKTFTQLTVIRFHQHIHVGVNKVHTSESNSSFKVPCTFPSHPLVRIGQILFPCEECGKTFVQHKALVKHRRTHIDDVLYQGLFYNNALGSTLARRDKDKKPQGSTKYGKRVFIHGGQAQKVKKPFKCRKCNRSFCSLGGLTVHERMHGKVYECAQCDLIFSRAFDFNRHCREAHSARPFKYEIYAKSFSYLNLLHSRKPVYPSQMSLECCKCGRTFRTNAGLNKHRQTHAGEKHFKCKECGKSFLNASSLNRHELTHTNVKPYECSECGKSFRTNAHLSNHRRIHTGEKPFKCEECGRSFTQSGYLTRHKLLHTGEKRFKCELCGKGYIQAVSLQHHMRNHTGERPYKCKACSLSFSFLYCLKRHQEKDICRKVLKDNMKRTEEKRHQCPKCNKSFKLSIALRKHMQSHANETEFSLEGGFTTENSRSVASKNLVHNLEDSDVNSQRQMLTVRKRYQCRKCNRSFKLSIALKKHMQSCR